MSYVITHNGRVILGPYGQWAPAYMAAIINRDTDQVVQIKPSDVDSLPLDLGNGIIVRNCVEVTPDYDIRIQRLDGPFWAFTADTGTATYTVHDRDLNLIKSELKSNVADQRYQKETTGTKVTIQGQEVTVETDRESRDIFVQGLMLMGDGDVRKWKFPKEGIWLTLTKTDLAQLVAGGASYIQAQFNWEEDLGVQIDAAVTSADLLAIYESIAPPAPEMPPV